MRKLKTIRQENIKKRKNFFPTLVFTVFLWVVIAGLIFFVDPSITGVVFFFFFLFFLATLFFFSLLLGNTRRGLILSTSLIIFIILRFFGVGNILNFLLISGAALTFELYFSKK